MGFPIPQVFKGQARWQPPAGEGKNPKRARSNPVNAPLTRKTPNNCATSIRAAQLLERILSFAGMTLAKIFQERPIVAHPSRSAFDRQCGANRLFIGTISKGCSGSI